MVHSDFIAVHWSTSTYASLSQQLWALKIYVYVTWVAMQKTSIARRQQMQNNSLNSLHILLGNKIRQHFHIKMRNKI